MKRMSLESFVMWKATGQELNCLLSELKRGVTHRVVGWIENRGYSVQYVWDKSEHTHIPVVQY